MPNHTLSISYQNLYGHKETLNEALEHALNQVPEDQRNQLLSLMMLYHNTFYLQAHEYICAGYTVANKQADHYIAALTKENDKLRRARNGAIAQAQIQAQEARTQKSIVERVGSLVNCENDYQVEQAVQQQMIKDAIALGNLARAASTALSDYQAAINSMEFKGEAGESQEIADDLKDCINKAITQIGAKPQ